MESRTQWTCLVDTQGQVSEWEDKTGKHYLSAFPQVIGYAQALLYSKRDALTFYYHKADENLWFQIALQRHQQEFTVIRAKQVELPFGLSKRELDILILISSGLSNTEIAAQLYISERTVAKHIEHIFGKTNIDNRTLLAVFAITENLCCLPLPGNLTRSMLTAYEIETIAKNRQALANKPFFSTKRESSRPIIIGVPYVEQGIGQIDTQELLNGTTLAVETINRQGGINGRELRIERAGFCVEDKKSILRAYQQLFDKEVDAISTSYACYSAETHELVASEGIPYLHLATHSSSNKLAQNLSPEKIDNIFQVCASDVNYSQGIMRFLQEYQYHYPHLVKKKHIVVITVKWQWIDIGIDCLIHTLRAQNWKVDVLELEQSASPFLYAMGQIHNLSPSLIVVASYFTEDIINFYTEFSKQPSNAIIYSIYAPSALLPHQQMCEGVLWATTTGLSANHVGQCFHQHYQRFFGHQPSYSQASVAYDQVQILANTWRHTVSPRNFKEVLSGIRSLAYHGVNGTYYFGADSQIGLTYPDDTMDLSISQPHLIFQIQQGKSKVIAPSLFAESAFRLPPWFKLK